MSNFAHTPIPQVSGITTRWQTGYMQQATYLSVSTPIQSFYCLWNSPLFCSWIVNAGWFLSCRSGIPFGWVGRYSDTIQ